MAEAMAIAYRLEDGLDGLPSELSGASRRRVVEFAGALVLAFGAQLGPIDLTTRSKSSGSTSLADVVVDPLNSALERQGYLLPTKADSSLCKLWEQAPFRLRAKIVEQEGPPYLQSANRTSVIVIDLALDRDGEVIWSEHLDAQTRIPMPNLSALEASRIGLATQPNAEVEHRLYEDARAVLLQKLDLKLKALPPPPEPTS